MDTTRHLLISAVLSMLIIIIGTAGYMLIEDWGILDALFMTIITISTVGYRGFANSIASLCCGQTQYHHLKQGTSTGCRRPKYIC